MIHASLQVDARAEPFAHAVTTSLLSPAFADKVLAWLETDAPWKLRVESFYEQDECALTAAILPPDLRQLLEPETIHKFADAMLAPLGAEDLQLVEATAHKLSGGQSIRIHNDYLDGEETHRILVQLNRGWPDENGGFLMFFSSPSADDVARIVRPLHGCAIAFEISPASYHAVSPARVGERYTLVFSFKKPQMQC